MNAEQRRPGAALRSLQRGRELEGVTRHDPIVVVDLPAEPAADTGDTVDVVQTAWQEPPREPTRYPSMNGNVANESDLPAPPEPPLEPAGEPAAG